MKQMRRIGMWTAIIGLLYCGLERSSLAVNDVGDPNCSVVDVMQPNRLIDVNPGDEFWLTVPVESRITAVQVHREGDKGWTWLKAGEFLPVQYNDPGEYTIRLRKANGLALPPFTVRVIGWPAEAEQPHGHNGQAGAGGVQAMAAVSGPSFSVGSVYAGDYVVGTNTVGKYPVRIVAFGIGDCTLAKYRDTNTWTWTFTADDFGTNSTAAKGGVIDGPPAGTNTWTLVKSCGGTHVLSPNNPSRLKVMDLILTNDLGHAPAPGSVANQTWYALTNETVTLRVMPGPFWVTNNPAAAASLFLWTTNNTALPVTTNLTQTFSPGVGTNLVNVACLSPAPATPTNQTTTINGVAVEFVHAEGDEVGQPMRNLPIFTPNDGVGKGQPIYDTPTTELSVVLTGALSPGSVDSIAVTYLGVQYALMETGLNTLTFTNSAITVTLTEAPLADPNVQESMTARVTFPAKGITDAVYPCQETTASSLAFENDPTGLVMTLSDLTSSLVDTIHLKRVNGFVHEWDLTETAADSRCFTGSNMVVVVLEPSTLSDQSDTLLVSLTDTYSQSNAVFRVRETGSETKIFRNYNEPIPTDLPAEPVPTNAIWQVKIHGLSDPSQLAGFRARTGIHTNDQATFSLVDESLLSDQKFILVSANVNPEDVPSGCEPLKVDELQVDWTDELTQEVKADVQFASATSYALVALAAAQDASSTWVPAAGAKAQQEAMVLQSLDWKTKFGQGLDPEAKIRVPLRQMNYTTYADYNAKKAKTLADYIRGKQIWYSMSHGGTVNGTAYTPFLGLKFTDGGIKTADINNLGLNYKLVIADGCCSAHTTTQSIQDARDDDSLIETAQAFANAWGAKSAYMGWGWEIGPPIAAQTWSSQLVNNLKFNQELGRGLKVQEAHALFRQQNNNAPDARLMKITGQTDNIIDPKTSN